MDEEDIAKWSPDGDEAAAYDNYFESRAAHDAAESESAEADENA